MISRRQFLCTAAAASAASFTRIPHALSATYDLIVKGGRVIDPSLGIDAVRDVAIAGGRIAAVGLPLPTWGEGWGEGVTTAALSRDCNALTPPLSLREREQSTACADIVPPFQRNAR